MWDLFWVIISLAVIGLFSWLFVSGHRGSGDTSLAEGVIDLSSNPQLKSDK